MKAIRLAALAALFAAASAVPARADGFITPFLGFNFSGDQGTNCASLTDCQDKRLDWGVGLGSTSGIFGFEEEIAYTKNFFGETPGGDNAVLTLMSNFMLVLPAGPIRPYAVAGVGLIHPHMKFNSSAADASANALGYDIGGGVNIFFTRGVALRGDVRHLQTFQDLDFSVFSNQKLDFWRGSAGLTFRF